MSPPGWCYGKVMCISVCVFAFHKAVLVLPVRYWSGFSKSKYETTGLVVGFYFIVSKHEATGLTVGFYFW